MKRTILLFAALLGLCTGIGAKVYTIDFNLGTVSGTSIKTSVKGKSPVDFCSLGADLFTLHTSTRSSFYNSEGCGIRIGDASGTGQAPFILTLCDEIQDKYIVKIVVYASRGTQNADASFKVYAANDVLREISFADVKDYDASAPLSTEYILPDINLKRKFKNLQVEGRNTNYVILHRIDIYTSDDDSEDAIPSTKVSFDETCDFYNLAGQRVSKPSRGIYIKGGKKYAVK